jgi:hypothetical protein
MLKGFKEFIVFSERLTALFGHVKSLVIDLLPPECGRFLPLITHSCINKFLKFLVATDLPSVFKAKRLFEIVIRILWRYDCSVLVVHDEPSDAILVKRLFSKSCFSSGLEISFSGFFLAFFLLLFYALLHFLQILNQMVIYKLLDELVLFACFWQAFGLVCSLAITESSKIY